MDETVTLNLLEFISILDILIISGIIQCYLIAVMLCRQKENTLANKLLISFLLIFALYQSRLILYDLNLNQYLPKLFQLPLNFILAIGPLLYLYTKSITNIKFKLTSKHLLHFLPVIPELLGNSYFNYVLITDHESYHITSYQIFSTLEIGLSIVSIIIYLHLSRKIIKSHTDWILNHYSSTKDMLLVWLSRLLKYYQVWWALMVPYMIFWCITFNKTPVFDDDWWLFVFFHLLLVIMNYFTYFIGLAHYKRAKHIIMIEPIGHVAPNRDQSNINKTPEDLQKLKQLAISIQNQMEQQQLYLEPSLSIYTLAKQLNIPQKQLFEVLNQVIGSRFHDFVNQYRVEEFIRKTQDPTYAHYTVLGMALASGFNSKATFNRIFKSMKGCTPTTYIEQIKTSIGDME